jgi:hypothetical protein
LLPPIWIPLQKFGFFRTPQDQQTHLFKNASKVTDERTIYSAGLKQALNAAIALNARTNGLETVFKAVGKAQLDLLLSGSKLEINETWLDFRLSHEKYPCRLSHQAHVEESIMDQFSCDHIVVELYKLILGELKRRPGLRLGQSSESDSSLCQRVRESLLQMPLMVAASPGRQSGEIEVSWTDLEGDLISRIYPLDSKCRITLHRESTCSSRRNDFLAPSK